MTRFGYTLMTEQVELLTYSTCPTMRYHPAVVAQKAATLALLSEGLIYPSQPAEPGSA